MESQTATGRSIPRRGAEGQTLTSWLWERGVFDYVRVARIENMHRWRYGSYRPSFLQDGIPLPDTASLDMAAD